MHQLPVGTGNDSAVQASQGAHAPLPLRSLPVRSDPLRFLPVPLRSLPLRSLPVCTRLCQYALADWVLPDHWVLIARPRRCHFSPNHSKFPSYPSFQVIARPSGCQCSLAQWVLIPCPSRCQSECLPLLSDTVSGRSNLTLLPLYITPPPSPSPHHTHTHLPPSLWHPIRRIAISPSLPAPFSRLPPPGPQTSVWSQRKWSSE